MAMRHECPDASCVCLREEVLIDLVYYDSTDWLEVEFF